MAYDYKKYDFIKPYNEINLEKEKQNSTKWLLSFINNSISDKNMQLHNISKEKLKKLYHFYLKQFNSKEIPHYEWLFKKL